ncbi:hypothetical protein LOAG_06758 [Loa loa]|uniref:Uncharacterized protein n=1 Tax=Loa loa TaxID=7209 RepID=A0A1I7VXN6_LOALO|nr:hypothetical protein LOAG_06758 [Loa loa]EFO21730.1 hypothetical protein LOAG_06758 [Loa loa]
MYTAETGETGSGHGGQILGGHITGGGHITSRLQEHDPGSDPQAVVCFIRTNDTV